jgi:hypothetical protein
MPWRIAWRQDLSAKTPASACSPPASDDRTGRICTATPCQERLPATSTHRSCLLRASGRGEGGRRLASGVANTGDSKSLPFCRSHPGVYRNPVDFPSIALIV